MTAATQGSVCVSLHVSLPPSRCLFHNGACHVSWLEMMPCKMIRKMMPHVTVQPAATKTVPLVCVAQKELQLEDPGTQGSVGPGPEVV